MNDAIIIIFLHILFHIPIVFLFILSLSFSNKYLNKNVTSIIAFVFPIATGIFGIINMPNLNSLIDQSIIYQDAKDLLSYKERYNELSNDYENLFYQNDEYKIRIDSLKFVINEMNQEMFNLKNNNKYLRSLIDKYQQSTGESARQDYPIKQLDPTIETDSYSQPSDSANYNEIRMNANSNVQIDTSINRLTNNFSDNPITSDAISKASNQENTHIYLDIIRIAKPFVKIVHSNNTPMKKGDKFEIIRKIKNQNVLIGHAIFTKAEGEYIALKIQLRNKHIDVIKSDKIKYPKIIEASGE